MEAILADTKRLRRSVQGILHAVSGAVLRNGVNEGSRRTVAGYRAEEGGTTMRDMYGRRGYPDIHSGREMFELYAHMSRGERSPF